jgi:adenosylhomocysteine nucleosidase
MVGIVFATMREAQPFLSQTEAERLTNRPLIIYGVGSASLTPCIVAISGMGKVAAAMAAAHLVIDRRVDALISAGLCGRLTPESHRAVGDLFRITAAVEGDCDRFGKGEPEVTCDPTWFGDRVGARLVTCDRPVFDEDRRARLAELGEVADMEGAAVARVAASYGITCAMIKGISDTADENGRRSVADNIDWVSARIADALVDELTAHQQKRT